MPLAFLLVVSVTAVLFREGVDAQLDSEALPGVSRVMTRMGHRVAQRSRLFNQVARAQTNNAKQMTQEQWADYLSQFMTGSVKQNKAFIRQALRGPYKTFDKAYLEKMTNGIYSTYRGRGAQQLAHQMHSNFHGRGAESLLHNIQNTFRFLPRGSMLRQMGQEVAPNPKTILARVQAGAPMIEAGAPLRNIFTGPVPQEMRAIVRDAVHNAYNLGKYTKADVMDAAKVLERGQQVVKQVAPKVEGNALEQSKQLLAKAAKILGTGGAAVAGGGVVLADSEAVGVAQDWSKMDEVE